MPNWAPVSPNLEATTPTYWRRWDRCLPFCASGLNSSSSGCLLSPASLFTVTPRSNRSVFRAHALFFFFPPSRPAVASYVCLAFGRYVVEPFFMPCVAPMPLIRLVSVLGVSECLQTFRMILFCPHGASFTTRELFSLWSVLQRLSWRSTAGA